MLPPDVRRDKDASDRYLPAIKGIVGQHLIGEAPYEEDAKRATDLIVLRLDAVRIACRVRSPGYVQRADYANEFTIRARRDNGAKTELAKVLEGWGDYFFYGHGDGAGGFAAWLLGDLRVFRLWFNRSMVRMGPGGMPGESLQNGDGTSFRSFKIGELPEGFVVARMAWEGAPA